MQKNITQFILNSYRDIADHCCNISDTPFGSWRCGRNVIINLRINTAVTTQLGIDLHVCELQLTLRSFAVLMVR